MFRFIFRSKKQDTMQWLQNPNQRNADNLNNVRHEASRHLRNKKKENLKDKTDKQDTKGQFKNIRDLYRGTSVFKKGYQPTSNTVKDETEDLVTDSHSTGRFIIFSLGTAILSLHTLASPRAEM
jgi:hypothetical protein